MRHLRKVKIVATLGPASSTYDVIKDLHQAGADVFRLNMSHGSHAEIRDRHRIIREIEKELASPIAILADLQGPKLRVGTFANGQETLIEGASFQLDLDPREGDVDRVCLPHREIFSALEVGAHLLVNDGKIRLLVEEFGADFAKCKVIAGGVISNHKGVNVPDVVLPLAALSQKDLKDLEFVCELGVDWLALSFVQRPSDVTEAKALIAGRAAVISKIEKPAAIENFDEILTVSDGIMVARGDLGVEIPPERVPAVQKHVVRHVREAGKPIVVATQMLESMTENPTATRAEVNDVANSVIDGSDAVMLSGETSVGSYPLKVVDTMRKIIRDVEGSAHNISENRISKILINDERLLTNAICSHACDIAKTTAAKAIITITYSGFNTIKMSSYRPSAFIYAFTNNHTILNTLSLVWGVQGFYYDRGTTTDQTISETKAILKQEKHLKKGDLVVNLASMPAKEMGMTNMMKISKIK